MTDSPLHFALREWREHLMDPKALGIAVCVSGAVAIAGPFETAEVLRLGPRFVYWVVLVLACYSVGVIASSYIQAAYGAMNTWLRMVVVALVTGTGVCAIVLLANLIVFNHWPSASSWPTFFGSIYGVSMLVSAGFHIAFDGDAPDDHAEDAPPSILDRLPVDKRGALLALSVEDHYVRILTSNGAEMVLMRLADAMREVGGTHGLQVHRSHWVATAAVASARREGDRAVLTLSDDTEIPVSRRYVPEIREAGLLPR